MWVKFASQRSGIKSVIIEFHCQFPQNKIDYDRVSCKMDFVASKNGNTRIHF